MKGTKKIVALLLAVLMGLSFVGCSSNATNNETKDTTKAGTEVLKILDSAYADEQYAMCLSKTNTDLLKKINSALAELKSSGDLDKIVNKYIDSDSTDEKACKQTAKGTNGTLVMATNAEFPPYEYMNGENVIGIDAEIMQAVCNKLDYTLKIENMEFDSIIPAVKSGKADVGAAGMTVTKDRQKEVAFTDTYATAKQVIIIKSDSAITNGDGLKGKKIGVQQGTTGDIYATGDFGKENVERYSKGAQAVQALIQGKVDAVIIDSQPAQAFVDNANA